MRAMFRVAAALVVAVLVGASPALAQTFSIQAEVLFLQRDIPQGVVTSSLTSVTVPPLPATALPSGVALRTDDLDFDYELGARFTLGFHPNANNSIEASYWGFHEWSDSARATGDKCTLSLAGATCTFLTTPSTGVGGAAFQLANTHDITYESEVRNAELNYWRHLSPWGMVRPSLLVGVRYMQIDEEFKLVATRAPLLAIPAAAGEYKIETKNQLLGLQLGGRLAFPLNKALSLGLLFKVGLMGNRAEQDSNVTANGVTTVDTGASEDGFATVAEARLFVDWNVWRFVHLTLGYDVFHVAGIALAPEQLASSNSVGAFSQLDRNGSALYHGPSGGLKIVW